MNDIDKTLINYFRDVKAVLNTPLSLPAFLTTPIQIPGLSKSGTGKRKRVVVKRVLNKTSQKPRSFVLEGTLRPGTQSKFSVSDTDFELDANTWIVGHLQFGAYIKVKGQIDFDKRFANQIIVLRVS